MAMTVRALQQLLELIEGAPWQAEFVVAFAPLVGSYGFHRVLVGLSEDPEGDVEELRFQLEAAFPGDVVASVLRSRDWQRLSAELDTLFLDAFQQGEVLLDRGRWRPIARHFQSLADRGLIMKTRRGWRRPGDAPRDPDAETMARLFQALRGPRGRLDPAEW